MQVYLDMERTLVYTELGYINAVFICVFGQFVTHDNKSIVQSLRF